MTMVGELGFYMILWKHIRIHHEMDYREKSRNADLRITSTMDTPRLIYHIVDIPWINLITPLVSSNMARLKIPYEWRFPARTSTDQWSYYHLVI